jgi:hypothetical protein
VDGVAWSVNEMRFQRGKTSSFSLMCASIKARKRRKSDLRKLDNSRNYARVAYGVYTRHGVWGEKFYNVEI